MYALCCKMNHSCAPNVIVMYKTRGWGSKHPLVAYAIALKDIQQGEQLCISYIANDAPLEKRQKELQHYGFTCKCSKCLEEMQQNSSPNGDPKQSENPEEDFWFGSDDSDSDDDNNDNEDDEENDNDETSQSEENGEIALGKAFERLDTVLNHATLGATPIPYLAQASKFIIQTAAAVEAELQDQAETLSVLLGK